MAAFTHKKIIRILKLKGAENYRPWAIYVKATLESKGTWDIFGATRAIPATLDNKLDHGVKDAINSYKQQNISARAILILSIDSTIITDNFKTSTVKEISDYYGGLYKKIGFVLSFTPFVHLIILKVSAFQSIKVYNTDCKIILNKLRSLGDILPDNLKWATYLYGIEELT